MEIKTLFIQFVNIITITISFFVLLYVLHYTTRRYSKHRLTVLLGTIAVLSVLSMFLNLVWGVKSLF